MRKETNPNPKWDVPGELIEWQISYTQKVRGTPPQTLNPTPPYLPFL